jgi:hypothetical protein
MLLNLFIILIFSNDAASNRLLGEGALSAERFCIPKLKRRKLASASRCYENWGSRLITKTHAAP